MCQRHYLRWYRRTPPELRPRPVRLDTVHDALAALADQQPGDSGCLVWRTGDRYPWLSYRGSRYKASHLAYVLHTGQDVPAGKWVLHACDEPRCIRGDHLLIGDAVINFAHMLCRERTGANVKLNWRDVHYIRCRGTSVRAGDLAMELGVCVTTIWDVRKHRTWTAKCA